MNVAAPAASSESLATFWRSLHALNATRIIIACVLLAYWGWEQSDLLLQGQLLCHFTSIAYLAMALVFAVLAFAWPRHFLPQLLAQILIDLTAVSALYISSGGMKSGFAILYLFPLASAAILMTLVLSLFFASLATFVLLFDSAWRILQHENDARLMQAGMYGAAFLAAVWVVNRMAARLISQEALAEQRGSDLRIQMAINRLAIAHMDDGFMVVDGGSTILAYNPAAAKLLGMPLAHGMMTHCRMADMPHLQPLAEAHAAWKVQAAFDGSEHEPVAPLHLIIKHGESAPTIEFDPLPTAPAAHVQARFVAVPTDAGQGERTIVFLQDVALIEQQAQQLKLASMGRLTASIAHEVRNPLASIGHAASLLSEDLHDPAQERLLTIVRDNVVRMNRMVGDILNLSRRAQAHEWVDLSALLAEVRESFRELHGLPRDMLHLDAEPGLRLRFDALHLREVVLNLLTNAIRYASGEPGSIRLCVVRAGPRRVELHVQDDGQPITPAVRAHLFEPFYTTSSKGTGLGLYLARELCLNNGAHLDYEYHRDGPQGQSSGRFVITFAPLGHAGAGQWAREVAA